MTSLVRKDCRLCGSTQLRRVLPFLRAMPLPDDYRWPAPLFNATVNRCDQCGHVQLMVVVDPLSMFSHYHYRTGNSPGLVQHFDQYARDLVALARLGRRSLMVDIGSNDGTLLAAVRRLVPCTTVGIDPAAEDEYTIQKLFDREVAREIVDRHGQADVVTANNVLAHVDDAHGFLQAATSLLKPNGWLVVEVGDFAQNVRAAIFETIYHEHLSYFSADTLRTLLRQHGYASRIQRVPTHGGSLRAICRRGPDTNVAWWADHPSVEDFVTMQGRMRQRREALLELLGGDAQVYAFGASAKASVLLWQYGLQPLAVIDDNPIKHGLVMPGTRVSIVPREALPPKAKVLVLAWNEAGAILRSLPNHRCIVAAPRPYRAGPVNETETSAA